MKKLASVMGVISSSLLHRKNSDLSAELSRLMTNGHVYVNKRGKSGYTPLMLALQCQHQRETIAKILALKELDVNIEDKHGKTVLMHLIDGQPTEDNVKLAKVLANHSSYNPNMKHDIKSNTIGNITGNCTDLIYAIANKRDDIAEVLLELRATDVNLEDADGRTVFTHILQRSFYYWETIYPMASRIVNHDSYNINQYHSDGSIDITNAIRLSKVKSGHQDMLGFLLIQPEVDINLRDHIGDTVYEMALEKADLGLLNQLLTYKTLDKNVLNSVDLAGRNVLHISLLNYSAKDHKYDNLNNFISGILSYPNLNVNAKDLKGMSAMLYIINTEDSGVPDDVIKKLIAHPKYNPCQTYVDGYVDMLKAAQKLPASAAVCVLDELLTKEKLPVNVSVHDTWGTVLRYVQKAIAKNGLSPAIKTKLKGIVQKLITHETYDVNKEFNCECDLLWASKYEYWELVEDLSCLHNIDINRTLTIGKNSIDKKFAKGLFVEGMTALHLACKFADRDSSVVCNMLKNDDIDVNLQDKEGFTALMYAVMFQQLYAVQAIINHPSNCQMNLTNKQNQTVYDLAKSLDHVNPMVKSFIMKEKKLPRLTISSHDFKPDISKSLDCLSPTQTKPNLLYPMSSKHNISDDQVDEGIGLLADYPKRVISRSMVISELHHKKILGCQSYLSEHLSPHDVLLHLQKVNVLQKDDAEDITGEGTRRGIVLKLMSFLLKRDHSVYNNFLMALRLTSQDYIADELEKFVPVELIA